jgi:hypothetical protein
VVNPGLLSLDPPSRHALLHERSCSALLPLGASHRKGGRQNVMLQVVSATTEPGMSRLAAGFAECTTQTRRGIACAQRPLGPTDTCTVCVTCRTDVRYNSCPVRGILDIPDGSATFALIRVAQESVVMSRSSNPWTCAWHFSLRRSDRSRRASSRAPCFASQDGALHG